MSRGGVRVVTATSKGASTSGDVTLDAGGVDAGSVGGIYIYCSNIGYSSGGVLPKDCPLCFFTRWVIFFELTIFYRKVIAEKEISKMAIKIKDQGITWSSIRPCT